MSLLLRKLLSAYFTLGVAEIDPAPAGDLEPPVGDEGGEAPSAPAAGAEDDDDDDALALVERTAEEEPAKARKREIAEVAEETVRRITESRPAPPPAPNAEAQHREREDAELEMLRRSGADESAIVNKQWEINTNRTLRAADQKANMAMFQSLELNDKSEFRALASDPAQAPFYHAYKDRVEKELAEYRRNGTNVPRITLLDYLMGKDRREGKFKVKAKAKAKAAEESLPRNVTRIERGRSPGVGARGDVARGGNAKQNTAESRLKNADGSYKRI